MMDDLINQIYEAGAMPELWPDMLTALARHFGAMGGLIMRSTINQDHRWVTSGVTFEHMYDFMAQGWMPHNPRIPFLAKHQPRTFLTDGNMLGEDQVLTMPMFNEFLVPRGLVAAMSTTLPGVGGDVIIMSLEGFPTRNAAKAAKANLDAIHGHLGRAAMFSSQLGLDRARTTVAAIEAVGAPAAVLRTDGTLRAANLLFQQLLGGFALDFSRRFQLVDAAADQALAQALHEIRWSKGNGASIPIRKVGQVPPSVLHVLPIRGNARDFFSDIMVLLVLAVAGMPNAPDAGLLQRLFDLTPAEARLAQVLVGGATVDEASAQLGVSRETTRTHVKGIYSKTGVRGQVELVGTLGRLAKPEAKR